MDAIGPGDLVECVDDRDAPEVVRGLIYTVTEVIRYIDSAGEYGIRVREAAPPDWVLLRGFRASRFRPVRRPDPSFIEGLLNLPLDVREDA